jgi:hypothetical protein
MVEVSGAFDFVLLLVLVVPGFISYVVLRYLAAFEEVPTDLHTVLYSLILSMLNYLPLSFLFSIIDMDSLRKMALSPAYVFASFLVSAGMGYFIGLIAKDASPSRRDDRRKPVGPLCPGPCGEMGYRRDNR